MAESAPIADGGPRQLCTWDEAEAAARLHDHPANHGEFDGGLSVWFVPAKEQRDALNRAIVELREAHGGAAFWPAHCTAFSPARVPAAEAAALASHLAATLPAFDVTVERVEAGSMFHQDVYVLLRRTDALMAARAAAREAFAPEAGPSEDEAFKPHISIVYGGHTDEQRGAIVDDARTRGVAAPGQVLRIAAIEVWRCHGPTADWERVASADLA